MTAWETVIGLEVHAQLKTATKLFCGCPTTFGATANHQTCPLCLGMPGTLPVLNRRAVELAALLGLAVEGTVHVRSVFDRKNYFYPDLPKGYQITQMDHPIVTGGGLWVETEERGRRFIRLTRIHMEEDAGMSAHGGAGTTRVDLNRSGTPLCEIVSEPDVRSAAEAMAYLKALRSVLRYTGTSDGNMEEGSFRCDANISLRPVGAEEFGTRVEIKNLNSFRFVGQAIDHEVRRQGAILESGGTVEQQTRRFDSKAGVTVFMRGKEDAHDYRYFPEPDLLPLELDEAWLAQLAGSLPELADSRARRFASDWGLSAVDAAILVADRELAEWFEAAVEAAGPEAAKALSNWTLGEVLRQLKEDGLDPAAIPLAPGRLGQLAALVAAGDISSSIAKKVFAEMWCNDGDPAEIIEAKGWKQISDTSAIDAEIAKVLAANPKQVEQYRGGKTQLKGFFVGQVMRATRGQANPKLAAERLVHALVDLDNDEV
ncbi:MAG: Asp-tRNA(Asn)/Glu-tRNA(Gln) amidotransferase subunit GatB [Proteobacteria bacterium]|nr:Asp-tRNA(Asn)/Glu-tRNA(Gln) amidotransferase subunit GatB [Pseudomonadota bacterium]